jgi:hypothetical protein
MLLRVAPHTASSGIPAMKPRVAPVHSSSSVAISESPGCPESSPPATPTMDFRVAPNLHLPVVPYLRLRVSPTPTVTAGPMMTLQLDANFASSDKPRMNLRIQLGHAHSRLTLDAFSIFLRPSTTGKPTVYLRVPFNLASSCQAETAFPIPYRVTTWIGVWTRSICGSKCKKTRNLWISPILVHSSIKGCVS